MKITGNIALKIFITFIIVLGLCGVGLGKSLSPQVRYAGCPERSEQVEISSKRVRVYSSSGKHRNSISYTFIVAFKLHDGSIKELEVDTHITRNSKEDVSCSLYNAINEGETGTLIYKELENIEEKYKGKEDMAFDGRLFISFEKDIEYGGMKVEARKDNLQNPWFWLLVAVIALVLVFLIRLGLRHEKRLGIR